MPLYRDLPAVARQPRGRDASAHRIKVNCAVFGAHFSKFLCKWNPGAHEVTGHVRFAAISLTIFFAIGGIAEASVFSQSFSGTVNAGVVDTDGLFGPALGNLAGDQIDITFSFDPSVYNTLPHVVS